MPRVSAYSLSKSTIPANRATVEVLPAPLLPTKNNLYDTSSMFGSIGRSSNPKKI